MNRDTALRCVDASLVFFFKESIFDAAVLRDLEWERPAVLFDLYLFTHGEEQVLITRLLVYVCNVPLACR